MMLFQELAHFETKGKNNVYKTAKVDFLFNGNNQWTITHIVFDIDSNVIYCPLAIQKGQFNHLSAWHFLKKEAVEKSLLSKVTPANDAELDQINHILSDVLKNYPGIPSGFIDLFEILPKQIEINKKYNTLAQTAPLTKEQKWAYAAELCASNNIIQRLNQQSYSRYHLVMKKRRAGKEK